MSNSYGYKNVGIISTRIAGKDAFYFSLKDNPEEIAENILTYLGQLQPHRMYRKVFCNYLWDNVYSDLLKPFLEEIVDAS